MAADAMLVPIVMSMNVAVLRRLVGCERVFDF